MSLLDYLIVIFFYFFCLWSFRYVNLILVVLLIGKAKKQIEGNVKEKLKGLKGE